MKFLTLFFSYLVPAVLLDSIWLFIIAKNFYAMQIGSLMGQGFQLVPAIFLYIIYTAGVTFFVTLPALKGNYDFLKIFLIGALFGFIVYATYDLTNQTVLKNWPMIMTLVDVTWGTLLTGTASAIAVGIAKIF
jgi:uncharacterized membrane protein